MRKKTKKKKATHTCTQKTKVPYNLHIYSFGGKVKLYTLLLIPHTVFLCSTALLLPVWLTPREQSTSLLVACFGYPPPPPPGR